MPKKNQYWGVLTVVSITSISLLMDNYFYNSGNDADYTLRNKLPLLCLFVFIAIMSVFINKEYIFNGMAFKARLILLIHNTFTGSVVDIAVMISFLLHLEWIPNSITEYARDPLKYWYSPIVYIAGLYFIIRLKPSFDPESGNVDAERRILLVTGISDLKYNLFNDEVSTNLTTILKAFEKYKNVKKVLVLLSNGLTMNANKIGVGVSCDDELYKNFSEYKEKINEYSDKIVDANNAGVITDALRILIQKCIQGHRDYKDTVVDIEFTAPVDYNDFEQLDKELYYWIELLQKKEKFSDEQMLVNISAGTSIASGVMTLHSIKGLRGMIYTKQGNSNDLIEYNPDARILSLRPVIEEFVNRVSGK